jgi:hypothetical protein
MNRWEYKVIETCTMDHGVYVVSEDIKEPHFDELAFDALIRLGREGWELVAVTQADIYDNIYETLYFKRQV